MIRHLSVEQILSLHQSIIGHLSDAGVRNLSALDSAVSRPAAMFDGEDLYPTLEAKAAALVSGLDPRRALRRRGSRNRAHRGRVFSDRQRRDASGDRSRSGARRDIRGVGGVVCRSARGVDSSTAATGAVSALQSEPLQSEGRTLVRPSWTAVVGPNLVRPSWTMDVQRMAELKFGPDVLQQPVLQQQPHCVSASGIHTPDDLCRDVGRGELRDDRFHRSRVDRHQQAP